MSEDQRPKPGANPARRARRIGGRPSPAGEPIAERADTPVRLDKTDTTADTSRPAAEPTTGARGRTAPMRGLPLIWFPAAVLGTAAVLLVAILVWFSHGGYWAKPNPPSFAEQEQKVLAAAKECFATLNTYDYHKLDEALAAGLKCTTGKFTSDYGTAFHEQIEKLAPKAEAVQSAQVNRAGTVAVAPDGDQWVVLIFGQLKTTNVSTEKDGSPRISPVGAVVTMEAVNDKWLVSKVDTDAGTGFGG